MTKSFVKINKHKFGYFLFSFNDKEMYVHNIDIYKKYQGKGLFKLLINEIKNIALKNNCNNIVLQPSPQDDTCYFNDINKLINLYTKYGFTLCTDYHYMECKLNS